MKYRVLVRTLTEVIVDAPNMGVAEDKAKDFITRQGENQVPKPDLVQVVDCRVVSGLERLEEDV